MLITKVGLKYNVRNRSLGSERESDMAKYSKEQIDAAIDAAMEVFGLESLKHQQREAIREFASGRDVFVALPTGFGKSYCFALLPTVFDRLRAGKDPSIVVCVSPLTALMMEQSVHTWIIGGVRWRAATRHKCHEGGREWTLPGRVHQSRGASSEPSVEGNASVKHIQRKSRSLRNR